MNQQHNANLSPIEQLLATQKISISQILALMIIIAIIAFVAWARVAHMQEFTIAQGEVVPQEEVQVIQHLEGGIIEEIMVREGSLVKQGESLMQLNITSFTANKEDLEIRLQGEILRRVRLQGQSQGLKKLKFPTEILQHFRPSLIASEQQVFIGQQQQLKSNLDVLAQLMEQKQADIAQLKTEITSIKNNLAVLREKLVISSELLKDQLASRLDHLQLKADIEELEGKLQSNLAAIPKTKSALGEAKERYHNEELKFRNKALEELRQVEIEIAAMKEMLAKAEDKVLRTTIKSPIDGVVKSLNANTIGGVVQPGEAIMEIVPSSSNMVIKAKLNPKDVGFVKTGQSALVKMDTYDYTRFGGLDGHVEQISADVLRDNQTGELFFEVKIRTDKSYLGENEDDLPITSGMQAMVDINTGNKTVMDYLLKPVIVTSHEAFRER